ncbi:RNA-binding motif protein, X-linked 2 [Stomoxys calcitrans]|uniref:RNA-binding motif protein, X-linked 2 n=1 Tax=Stomoxys calcitrans TaxID=35570 RepID=UPI0027E3A1E1|nr:RNA-binding motif protein, X-linked 2 [Stomoxys calcitrans]XP_013099480.2 RNA-binding motif protein, X-linked 2 [Stomoxys calcitrans]
MNPLTNMKNVTKLSEYELNNASGKASWHDMYKDSAWIFVGGFPYTLTEGDLLCVFSQYGEIVNIHLVRDKESGKSKGFCFICYEDRRSTVLAVDNLNGIKLLNRSIRVDHVTDYKPPKDGDNGDGSLESCAPLPQINVANIKPEKEKKSLESEYSSKEKKRMKREN